eukprot:1156396-Pelagomonas_calceolata.AAC.7
MAGPKQKHPPCHIAEIKMKEIQKGPSCSMLNEVHPKLQFHDSRTACGYKPWLLVATRLL